LRRERTEATRGAISALGACAARAAISAATWIQRHLLQQYCAV
jgi:hypothetical protein